MTKICILYGGRSGEHEVSLRSAASAVQNLDKSRYSVIAIGIDKEGRWHLQDHLSLVSTPEGAEILAIKPSRFAVSIVPSHGIYAGPEHLGIDCVFPVLHGSFGEDGTVQGLLEIANLPYVGAGVLGSAAAMDKETAKRLWRDSGLPIVDFGVVHRSSTPAECESVASTLGWPLFVKPCAAGSSLGTSRVAGEHELHEALMDAFRFDTRALLERYVDGREIECSVVGNSIPRPFVPGEIVPTGGHAYYDYDAKYIDPSGAELVTTASLDDDIRNEVMRIAVAAYAAVRCSGMARVDFFLERKTDAIFLNEINTIPGFTSISMFPRMCSASGLCYSELLDTLVKLALEQHDERQSIEYGK
jgi:D-alanine-D-alanine ligase